LNPFVSAAAYVSASERIAACLAQAQDDVQAHLGRHKEYYIDEYRPRENHYWEHVPRWIAGLPKRIRVLDVGAAYCTLAVFTRRMLDAEVIALDTVSHFQPAALLTAAGIRHVTRNVELEELSDLGTFELIIFTEALEHLNFQPVPTLRKLRGALVPGGTLLLSTPDAASNWGRTTKYYKELAEIPAADPSAPWIDDHLWQYDRAELEGVLVQAGFAIREILIASGNDGGTHLNVRATRLA